MNILADLTNLHTDLRLHDLAALLQRPQPFNILTALGLSRQELRHSDLLAFLSDPRRPHGLGSRFTRALLRRAASLSAQVLDADALHLETLSVRREWNFVDILIDSPADQLVIIIENKIDTSEHSNQLGRYYKLIEQHRPGWRIVGIYLTLDGGPPASAPDRYRYISLGYADIAAILLDIAADSQTTPDVRMLLRHYAHLIRSELVPEPNADQALLGHRLYMEHRAAIDSILQARDARMRMIQRCFDELFAATLRDQPESLAENKFYKNTDLPRWQSRFAPIEWDCPVFRVSTPWTRNNLLVVFEFMHGPNGVDLMLTVGPAREAEQLRHKLYDLARQHVGRFAPTWNDPGNAWFNIYHRPILSGESKYFV